MKILIALVPLALTGFATAAVSQTKADPGAAVFARSCAMCHAAVAGAAPKMGPNLAGLKGRKAGAIVGFRYSPAMAKAGVSWDARTLDSFLAKPGAVVPGNRMGFGGIPSASDRAAVTAYLIRGK